MRSLILCFFIFCLLNVIGCGKKTDVANIQNTVEALCQSTGIYYATFIVNKFTSVSLFAKGEKGEIKFLELSRKKNKASIDGKPFNNFANSNNNYKILVTVRGVDKPNISDADEIWITLSVNSIMTYDLFSNPFKRKGFKSVKTPKLINDKFAQLLFSYSKSSCSISTNGVNDCDYVLTLRLGEKPQEE